MALFMIIATIKDSNYLTKVKAESASGAEHLILDLSICGRHTYGVTACMAFSSEDMKYDTFIFNALDAEPISFEALKEIIEQRNAEIKEKDEAEERIRKIEQSMKNLQEELKQARAILSA